MPERRARRCGAQGRTHSRAGDTARHVVLEYVTGRSGGVCRMMSCTCGVRPSRSRMSVGGGRGRVRQGRGGGVGRARSTRRGGLSGAMASSAMVSRPSGPAPGARRRTPLGPPCAPCRVDNLVTIGTHALIAAGSPWVRPLPRPSRIGVSMVATAVVVWAAAFPARMVRSSSYAISSSVFALVILTSASRGAVSLVRRSDSSEKSAVVRAARLRTPAAGCAAAQSSGSLDFVEDGERDDSRGAGTAFVSRHKSRAPEELLSCRPSPHNRE